MFHNNKDLLIKLDLNKFKEPICLRIKDLKKKWKFKKLIFLLEMPIYVSFQIIKFCN
jgi:hypothetical protein